MVEGRANKKKVTTLNKILVLVLSDGSLPLLEPGVVAVQLGQLGAVRPRLALKTYMLLVVFTMLQPLPGDMGC